MSASAIALSAYITALGESMHNENQQHLTLIETSLVIDYQAVNIPFSHQQWRILDHTVCQLHDRNSSMYSDCSVTAKSLFNQICSALTNQKNVYWHHQQYKQMYCDAAINFQPMVATISYGKSTQMSVQERKCNQLILKALVDPSEQNVLKKKTICKNINKDQ